MRSCKVKGCKEPYRAKGFCQPHYAQKWQRDHKELSRIKNRRWRKDNPESVRAAKRRWYWRHVEERRKKSREYQKLHPEVVRARRHRRRAIKNGIEGVHFTPKQFTELIAKYNHRCVCCLKTETQLHRLGRKLVPDHVVPLSWGQPYSDEIENIQPLCSTCNNSKGARRATDYRKTFRLRLDILLNRA